MFTTDHHKWIYPQKDEAMTGNKHSLQSHNLQDKS